MRIGAIGGTTAGHAPRRASAERIEPEVAESSTRVLVAVEEAAPGERCYIPARHPSAPFLAHLLATKMHEPQTRARRRAEPEEAAALYGAMGPVAATGRKLRLSA